MALLNSAAFILPVSPGSIPFALESSHISISILTYVAVVALLLVLALYNYVRIPEATCPRIFLLFLFISVLSAFGPPRGQDEMYDCWLREPLEKYGAVNMWFAGR